METMPRTRPPYLTREIRAARVYWYFRRDKGPRIALPGAFGSKEFTAAYQAALAGNPIPKGQTTAAGTMSWLIDRYMDSSAWNRLSVATRRQRGNIFKKVKATAGNEPFQEIDRGHIKAAMEKRTPAAARHLVETLRGMFQWALDADIVAADPTRDVKPPKKSTEGHHTWTDEEIAAFETKWPLGTRERLAFDLMLFTGLRRGDAVLAGRQHVRDGVLTLRTAPRQARRSQSLSCQPLPHLWPRDRPETSRSSLAIAASR